MKIRVRILTFLLCLSLFLSIGISSAADQKPYKYICLGDSISAGHSDIQSVKTGVDITVDYAFHSIVARSLNAGLCQYAITNSKTCDIRRMLEEGYENTEAVYGNRLTPDQLLAIRENVRSADLVTVNSGANDIVLIPLTEFAEKRGWDILADAFSGDSLKDELLSGKYDEAIKDILKTLTNPVEFAKASAELTKAMTTGYQNYATNWDSILNDLNCMMKKDARLVVLGLYNPFASYKDMQSDNPSEALLARLADLLTPIILSINRILVSNASAHGYQYVSLLGIDTDWVHPSEFGHQEIANRIIKVLEGTRLYYLPTHPVFHVISRIFKRRSA